VLTRILVLVAAAVAAACLTGTAAAARPAGDLLAYGVQVVEQAMDASGRPVGPPHVLTAAEAAGHRPDAADLRGENRAAAAGARTARLLQGSGCRQVSVNRYATSVLFGKIVYRFWQDKYWCWSYPRVTSVSVSTHVSDMDPNWYYRGLTSSSSWFYTWCCGNGSSGHYSLRQGRMENCVLKFGCIGTEYPWVKIWARGDGSYSWSTGK
jgi:hypothetical protein